MTNRDGKLIGDLMVACLAPAAGVAAGRADCITAGATGNIRRQECFVVFASGIAERYCERWFDQHLPDDSSVRYRTLGWEMCGLSIAGPNSRELLSRVSDADVSGHGMCFMSFREIDLGLAPVWCGRLSYTGDLGYELWIEVDPLWRTGCYAAMLS